MQKLKEKICCADPQRVLQTVFVLYALLLTVLSTIYGTQYQGEAGSYTLTAVSLVRDHNGMISPQDIATAQSWFPDWAWHYEGFTGSGYTTAQGIVPWYFPTYPAACIPMLVLLRVFSQPLQYAFCLTNLALVLLLLAFVVWDARLKLWQRWLLFALFAGHSALLYISWASAEVFQFVGVAFAALCWATGRKHRAALCIAAVGTTNPCALALGLAMIAEYLLTLFLQGKKGNRLRALLGSWRQIVLYGCCYLPGLVPFAYNYRICGGINLTAAHANEWVPLGDGTALRQLWAYFTDWNFGIFPYMPLLLAVGVVLAVPAVLRRCARYFWMWLGMLGMMFGCALMRNIDCGMTGIARYNAWSSAVLVVAVCTQLPVLLRGIRAKRAAAAALACSALYSAGLTAYYNGNYASTTCWEQPTPLALAVLQYAPALYTPLPGTFVRRANGRAQVPFAYYRDETDALRKLYVGAADVPTVRAAVGGDAAALARLDAKLAALGEAKQYIDIPHGERLYITTWTENFDNGLDVALGTLQDGVLTTGKTDTGYAMLGPNETLVAGDYTVTLLAECTAMPPEAPAQLQAGIAGADGFVLLASAPVGADGSAAVHFTLEQTTEALSYRVYQNEGTSLAIHGVVVTRTAPA